MVRHEDTAGIIEKINNEIEGEGSEKRPGELGTKLALEPLNFDRVITGDHKVVDINNQKNNKLVL